MGENFYPTQAAFSLSPLSILAGRHANGALHSGEEGKEESEKFLAKNYVERQGCKRSLHVTLRSYMPGKVQSMNSPSMEEKKFRNMTRARGRDFPAIGKGFHGYYPTSIVTIAANISFRERETGCMKGPPSPSLPSFVDRRRPSFAAFAKKGQVFGTPTTPTPFLPTSAFRPLQRRIERAPFFAAAADNSCGVAMHRGRERPAVDRSLCVEKRAKVFFCLRLSLRFFFASIVGIKSGEKWESAYEQRSQKPQRRNILTIIEETRGGPFFRQELHRNSPKKDTWKYEQFFFCYKVCVESCSIDRGLQAQQNPPPLRRRNQTNNTGKEEEGRPRRHPFSFLPGCIPGHLLQPPNQPTTTDTGQRGQLGQTKKCQLVFLFRGGKKKKTTAASPSFPPCDGSHGRKRAGLFPGINFSPLDSDKEKLGQHGTKQKGFFAVLWSESPPHTHPLAFLDFRLCVTEITLCFAIC